MCNQKRFELTQQTVYLERDQKAQNSSTVEVEAGRSRGQSQEVRLVSATADLKEGWEYVKVGLG